MNQRYVYEEIKRISEKWYALYLEEKEARRKDFNLFQERLKEKDAEIQMLISNLLHTHQPQAHT